MVDVKRLAADILGVGVSRVKISSEAIDRLHEVVTKDDVRALINEGLIWAEPEKGFPGGVGALDTRRRNRAGGGVPVAARAGGQMRRRRGRTRLEP
jgi:LSU ribosomal protein L19E